MLIARASPLASFQKQHDQRRQAAKWNVSHRQFTSQLQRERTSWSAFPPDVHRTTTAALCIQRCEWPAARCSPGMLTSATLTTRRCAQAGVGTQRAHDARLLSPSGGMPSFSWSLGSARCVACAAQLAVPKRACMRVAPGYAQAQGEARHRGAPDPEELAHASTAAPLPPR